MKTLFLTLAATTALAIAAPAIADGHGDDHDTAAASLDEVLAADRRDGDRARDSYRRPAQTLDFFKVTPDQTVVEFAPGGGWYTRVLAPYLSAQGTYLAVNFASPAQDTADQEGEAPPATWAQKFKQRVGEMLGQEAESIHAFEVDEVPEQWHGTADRALIFRSMHGLNMNNIADSVLKQLRKMLKADGMVGVVQHRAPQGASYDDYGARQRGYMRQQDVIAIFVANGFELVEQSEINANPDDPANWERGVWTLPPALVTGEDDPERAQYLAIGESDRMTLLFKKAD